MVIFGFWGYFDHFLGFGNILDILEVLGGILLILEILEVFWRYFGHLWVLGVFWSFLGFKDILVIFWVSGVMIPSKISKLVSIKR